MNGRDADGLSPFEASASLRRLRVTILDVACGSIPYSLSTWRHSFASSRRISPELCFIASPSFERGRREDREPAGTRGPLCETCVTRSCTAAYRCSQDIPALPAQWLYGLCRALPGERCTIAPVALRMADGCVRLDDTHHHKTWRTDPGRQDDTILPYADHTGRVRDGLAHSCPPCKTLRADVTCVHRRPARVRDDRDTPLFLGPG
ncbi:hypothetical protein GGD65_005491 [Bradyrhizobium sp. CIR18]|nr:hypothetical protein [Bradyrhizobium sp. CIR18]